jgi:hypothetical protein
MEKEKGGGEREGWGDRYITEREKREECLPPHEYMSMRI